jgi:hypothetical protein
MVNGNILSNNAQIDDEEINNIKAILKVLDDFSEHKENNNQKEKYIYFQELIDSGVDHMSDLSLACLESRNNRNYPILELAKHKKDKGCYIFLEISEGRTKGIPLYVGRTVSFLSRFYQHANRYELWKEKYFNTVANKKKWVTDMPGYIVYGVWLIEDNSKRVQKEHELIGKYKPLFNTG